MKYILTLVALALGGILCAPCAYCQDNVGAKSPKRQSWLHQAADNFGRYETVAARIRHTGEIFDQPVQGEGHYLHWNQPDGPLMSLELKLSVGGQQSVVQQIRDDRFLWVRRDLPNRKNLIRVDLNEVAMARREHGGDKDEPSRRELNMLGFEGISKLLLSLDDFFVFGPPEPVTIANVEMLKLQGEWRRKRVGRVLKEQASDIVEGKAPDWSEIPPHIPSHVAVYLCRKAPGPLFPFRVEYLRKQGDDEPPKTLLKLELYEVRINTSLDPRHFIFPVGNQEVVDATDDYIANLRRGWRNAKEDRGDKGDGSKPKSKE